MATPFTHKNIKEAKDSAPDMGFGEVGEMRFAGSELDASDTGFTYHRLDPNVPGGFGHRHQDAEEVYFVISGSGRAKLDDEIIEIAELDVIRVAPETWRGFSSGPDGLEVVAFGPHHEGDGEIDPEWWDDK